MIAPEVEQHPASIRVGPELGLGRAVVEVFIIAQHKPLADMVDVARPPIGADFVVYKTQSTVTNIAPASTENIEPYEPKTRTMEPIVKAYEPTYNHSFEPAFTVLTVNSYN